MNMFLVFQSGISVESERDFHVQLHCTHPGQTTIRLTLEMRDKLHGQVKDTAILTDEITFQVTSHGFFFPNKKYMNNVTLSKPSQLSPN